MKTTKDIIREMRAVQHEACLRKTLVGLLKAMIAMQRTESFMPMRALHSCAFTIMEELEGQVIENVEHEISEDDSKESAELVMLRNNFHGLQADMRGMMIGKERDTAEIARLKYKAGETFREEEPMLTNLADGTIFEEAESDD